MNLGIEDSIALKSGEIDNTISVNTGFGMELIGFELHGMLGHTDVNVLRESGPIMYTPQTTALPMPQEPVPSLPQTNTTGLVSPNAYTPMVPTVNASISAYESALTAVSSYQDAGPITIPKQEVLDAIAKYGPWCMALDYRMSVI